MKNIAHKNKITLNTSLFIMKSLYLAKRIQYTQNRIDYQKKKTQMLARYQDIFVICVYL